MIHCKDCRYWDRRSESERFPCNGGACSRDEFGEWRLRELPSSEPYYWDGLYTGPEFGCVYGEAKEAIFLLPTTREAAKMDTPQKFSSWYYESQLTLSEEGGEHLIEKIHTQNEERRQQQTDMAWIVASWPTLRDSAPGYTTEYLMKRIGIENPWGPHGEGTTYHRHWLFTRALIDDAFATRSVELANRRLDEIKARVQSMKKQDFQP